MANSPAKAVKVANSIVKGYKGLCLVFVRTCYGINAKYPSAIKAWENAEKRHVTKSLGSVPIGAPVFFSSTATVYGHVAIYLGNGKFRTNYSAKGIVITAPLSHPVFAGMTMLGWTEDINDVEIEFDSEFDPKIKAWQLSMNRVFPAYADFAGDGKFESYSVKVTKEFQRRSKLKQTGKLDAPTVKAMRANGVKI